MARGPLPWHLQISSLSHSSDKSLGFRCGPQCTLWHALASILNPFERSCVILLSSLFKRGTRLLGISSSASLSQHQQNRSFCGGCQLLTGAMPHASVSYQVWCAFLTSFKRKRWIKPLEGCTMIYNFDGKVNYDYDICWDKGLTHLSSPLMLEYCIASSFSLANPSLNWGDILFSYSDSKRKSEKPLSRIADGHGSQGGLK